MKGNALAPCKDNIRIPTKSHRYRDFYSLDEIYRKAIIGSGDRASSVYIRPRSDARRSVSAGDEWITREKRREKNTKMWPGFVSEERTENVGMIRSQKGLECVNRFPGESSLHGILC